MNREELLKVAKPILFNTEMVKAILEGRKTVTRRCVKYKYSNTEMKIKTDKYGTRLIEIQKDVEGETYGKYPDGRTWHKLLPFIEKKPPFKKGNILYVRETWCKGRIECGEEPDGREALYISQCTGEDDYIPYEYAKSREIGMDDVKWKPSIHMPKEAARIFLKVKSVNVERLQNITKDQILDEGTNRKKIVSYIDQMPEETEEFVIAAFRLAWSELWDSTIKKQDLDTYDWDANPWVWVIEFERIEVE